MSEGIDLNELKRRMDGAIPLSSTNRIDCAPAVHLPTCSIRSRLKPMVRACR